MQPIKMLFFVAITTVLLTFSGVANAGSVKGAAANWNQALNVLPPKIAAKERALESQLKAVALIRKMKNASKKALSSAISGAQERMNELEALRDQQSTELDRLLDCVGKMSPADFASLLPLLK